MKANRVTIFGQEEIIDSNQVEAIKNIIYDSPSGHILMDKEKHRLFALLWELRNEIITSQMTSEEIRKSNDTYVELAVEIYKALGVDIRGKKNE